MNEVTPKQRLQRGIMVLLIAIAFALALLGLGSCVGAKNRAFAERGLPVKVQIMKVEGRGKHVIAHFEHDIDGRHYRHNAKPAGNVKPGQWVAGLYLPEDPERVRLLPADEATISEQTRPFRMLALLFVVVGVFSFLLTQAASSRRIGLLFGALFLGLILAVNFDPEVQAVQRKALGDFAQGVPAGLVVSALELVLLGPALFLLGGPLFTLTQARMKRGAGLSGFSFILWLVRGRGMDAELLAARRRLLAIGAYLLLLMLAWIAFAASKGI